VIVLLAQHRRQHDMRCKGMVQISGKTYRIMKIDSRSYQVVRILDDVCIGHFEVTPRLQVQPDGVPQELLFEIAVTALREAKLSWPAHAPAPPVRRDSQGLVGSS
jgi:hypothetical protein